MKPEQAFIDRRQKAVAVKPENDRRSNNVSLDRKDWWLETNYVSNNIQEIKASIKNVANN